jgi:hypothetical protein
MLNRDVSIIDSKTDLLITAYKVFSYLDILDAGLNYYMCLCYKRRDILLLLFSFFIIKLCLGIFIVISSRL